MAKILVIDDDPDIGLLLSTLLQAAGHEVRAVASGPVGLDHVVTRPTDLVLLDVQMPVMDGWHTLARIRGNPSTELLPVLMCTVKSSPEDIAHGWELGCDGYVSKPFDVRTLLHLITETLAMQPEDLTAHRRQGLEAARHAMAGTR